jgi:hypothetical protein
MSRRLWGILRRLPTRRRRHWRYISPRRRGAGVAILALLAAVVLTRIYLPPLIDEWTRRQVARYLRDITGGRVTIREASFGLFSGVSLRGVAVDVPNSPSAEPFFRAGTVVLRHRPWSLLSRRRLEPTEIVCIAPTVTLKYDPGKRQYTAVELLDAARRRGRLGAAGGFRGRLPIISIRNVRLQAVGQMLLNISMVPTEGGKYRVVLAEERGSGQEVIRGTLWLDLVSGETRFEGEIPIPNLEAALPKEYAQWRRQHKLRGKVLLKGRPGKGGGEVILEAELADVSLRLPAEQGGLDLAGVRGTLVFDEKGVSAKDLRGRIPAAGGGTFRLSGRYEKTPRGGYDANSPFEIEIDIRDLIVPDGAQAAGTLASRLRWFNERFQPAGRLSLSAKLRRLADGRIVLNGTARAHGMSCVYRAFPYPVKELSGSIRFSNEKVTLVDLTGRHGPGRLTVRGEVDPRTSRRYDVTVSARDVALDEALRNALPKGAAAVWDGFRPAGAADGSVRVRRAGDDQPESLEITFTLDGAASASWKGFPYRLAKLAGEVRITNDRVEVKSVRGRHGRAQCTVDGTILSASDSQQETRLTVLASDLPLDADLVAALPATARKAVKSLRVTGRAERATARVRHRTGERLDFRVEARLRGATFRPEAFPYLVTDANGVVTVQPDRVILEGIRGRHGPTALKIDGQALLIEKGPGLDLGIQAVGLLLDAELFEALPPKVKRFWRRLSPSGRADVDLALRHRLPEADKELDYELTVRARGMGLRSDEFPYPLQGVTGRAILTPGRVRLEDMKAARGEAELVINGELTTGPQVERARLAVRGRRVPIDREFLGAIPPALAPLARRFRPGGTCDLNVTELRIARRAGGGTASAPASRPAEPSPAAWAVKGRADFDSAVIDLGLGHKTLSGSVRGSASQTAAGLAVDAGIELDSVRVAKQRLTAFRGRLAKEPASQLLRLADLSAKAHGGLVAGFAEVRLADPLEYGISLSVKGLRLEELFGAGVSAPARRLDVKGLLDGNIQLTVTPGKKPARQASGVLRIDKAKLYKLPVMLGLLHVVYLTLPGESAFTGGNVTYHLREDTLVFDEIYLRGSALSIVGSGTMDMKTEALRLTFLAGPPRKLPRIGSLDELVVRIARELAEIRITGRLRNPQIRTVPLSSLDRVIRDLLNPGRDRD